MAKETRPPNLTEKVQREFTLNRNFRPLDGFLNQLLIQQPKIFPCIPFKTRLINGRGNFERQRPVCMIDADDDADYQGR